MIRSAKIIQDTTSQDEVGLGKIVTLGFPGDDDKEEFEIVTTIEADPLNNKISIESPIGKAIYKHKLGEELSIISPEGEYKVKVLNIALKK